MHEDVALAGALAEEAGQLLLALRAEGGDDLRKRGDAQSNALLLDRLAAARPSDAVLSEEAADDKVRLGSPRVWIIDPLDGTREFGMPGRDDWAVHVALWERSLGLTAAAVAQPSLGTVYRSDTATLGPAPDGPMRILVSDSRPPAWAAAVAERLDAELVSMGSAGAKAMAVLRGDAHAYVHDGGQWEWDSAAPVGVLNGAGVHTSRADGSVLTYNEDHPYLPDLLLCRPELAGDLLQAIRLARSEMPSG